VHAYVRDADDTIEWIEEKDLLLSSEDYGHDLATVQALIVKQEGFEVSVSVLLILYIIEDLSVCVSVCLCILNRLLNHASDWDQTLQEGMNKYEEGHCIECDLQNNTGKLNLSNSEQSKKFQTRFEK